VVTSEQAATVSAKGRDGPSAEKIPAEKEGLKQLQK
jgi:hypothetical protein